MDLNQCDFNHATYAEVRRLPYTKDGGAIIICYNHYIREMNYRKQFTKETGVLVDIPAWEDLEVYKST